MFSHPALYSLMATAPFVMATGYAQAATVEKPAAIQALEAQGLTITEEFDAEGDVHVFAGMIGDRPIAIYMMPDGYAIVGTRVDTEGNAIDEPLLQALVAKPISEQAWGQLEEATWVADGSNDAPRIVYTFTDANCPYCHLFWEAARPWVDEGKVQLRHLLVGIIKEDSPAKAASILTASDPSAALQENELKFDEGGIKPATTVSDEVLKTLEDNQALMLSLGFRGTPGIVVQTDDGLIEKYHGMPQGNDLNTILGPR